MLAFIGSVEVELAQQPFYTNRCTQLLLGAKHTIDPKDLLCLAKSRWCAECSIQRKRSSTGTSMTVEAIFRPWKCLNSSLETFGHFSTLCVNRSTFALMGKTRRSR